MAEIGIEAEVLRGMIQNQKDYVREEGNRILSEMSKKYWISVERAMELSGSALDREFGDKHFQLEQLDWQLENTSIEVMRFPIYLKHESADLIYIFHLFYYFILQEYFVEYFFSCSCC